MTGLLMYAATVLREADVSPATKAASSGERVERLAKDLMKRGHAGATVKPSALRCRLIWATHVRGVITRTGFPAKRNDS
jgi:hypothetical protein